MPGINFRSLTLEARMAGVKGAASENNKHGQITFGREIIRTGTDLFEASPSGDQDGAFFRCPTEVLDSEILICVWPTARRGVAEQQRLPQRGNLRLGSQS